MAIVGGLHLFATIGPSPLLCDFGKMLFIEDCFNSPRRHGGTEKCYPDREIPCLRASVVNNFKPANKGEGTLRITVVPTVGGKPLILNNQPYQTPHGDSIYMDVLRFYLSAIQLQGQGIDYEEKDSYHLINAEEPGAQTIVLKNIPVGRYKALIFNAGTDSLTNVAGAMGGDLDPTRGMYWAWNTGYINVKIEGRSKACSTLHHAFEFHIGGYMPPNQTVRRVALPLKNLVIRENATTSIQVHVDLAQFFSHINLASTNQVMIPGAQAAQLADYFADVFSVN